MKVFNCKKTILKVWVHNYQNKNNYYFYFAYILQYIHKL
jgi:hypothetical protein